MAGLRQHSPAPRSDIAMVAHPSVTLLIDLSERDGLVYDTHGRSSTAASSSGSCPAISGPTVREPSASRSGWSRQRLWSRFRSQLGITPKCAAGLVRFDHAAHLLASGHAPASVASESGYADQSHLHREVKAFTGLTPTAVAAAPWLAIDDVAWPDS